MKLFDFFTKENDPTETGLHLKNAIIGSIVAQLRQLALLTHAIKGITLYITAPETSADELAHRAVLNAPSFKSDLQRHLTDHFLELPPNWNFNVETKTADFEHYIALSALLRMQIQTTQLAQVQHAFIQALVGKLWQDTYELRPDSTLKYAIGRGKTPQLASGRIHKNDIAFIADDEQNFDPTTCEANNFVSRYHGFVVYDAVQKQFAFKLAAGVSQAGHHTRILRTNGHQEESITVNNDTILYYLQHGDQLQFNRKAMVEFLIKR